MWPIYHQAPAQRVFSGQDFALLAVQRHLDNILQMALRYK